MTRLTRTDLINWADTKPSEGQLPELIRRLIFASNQTVEAIVMPYGDSVGRSGLDGYVRAIVASAYVATGESIWELGTNKDNVSKAKSDFNKRNSSIAPFRQQDLTYHCVTPRHWEKKAEWVSKQKNAGQWKAIRVYDVDDLLGWLSDCPSVEAWFSRKLGNATAGVRDVHEYWENVGRTDSGIVNSQVLLAGREELAKRVQSHFANTLEIPKPLAISSRSSAEVVPFVVVSIIDSSNEAVIVSTVVVDSRTRWEQLIVEESELGLIVTPQVQPTREELQQAFSSKHRVVYCSPTADLKLPRLSEFEVCKSLVASGIGEGEATQHAKQCGGNGQLLLDRLSGLHAPAGTLGSSLDDRVKVACLLLVAWDGEHAADREVFEILTGIPYEDIEASLVSDSNDPNGLLFRADGKYRLLSPELAWVRYATLITKSVIENFADVVRYVLADDDPTAGMSGVERLTAQFLGKRPEFSPTLRRNVVHALAIAGSIGATRLNLDPSMSPAFVDWIVQSTLEDASFSRWASLRSELPILAEAAPDALLDALERDLRPDGPLREVMDNTDTDLISSPAHIGILWALERLCWCPDYLERAVSVLLGLAELNQEIKSGNNPSRSVRETLQLYCPQTNADWAARQRTITRILKQDTGTAFRLIVSLFPSGYSSWIHREAPTWRDWAYGYESRKTYHQIAIELRWCVEQLLLFANDEADRWCALLELCGDIDDEQFDEILDSYEQELANGAFSDDAKRLLWETINAMLVGMEWRSARRRLKNGDIVDEAEIEDPEVESEPHFPREVKRYTKYGARLRQLLGASTPDDPVLAGCRAFLSGLGNNHCSRHFSDRFNYEKQQEQIDEKRKLVVENVQRSEGIDGLLRLATISHVDAGEVGRATAALVGNTEISIEELLSLFSSSVESDRLFASGFVIGWAWERKDSLSRDVLPLLPTISCDETKASFLRCLHHMSEVWECVDSQNETIRRLYWKNASVPWEIPEGMLTYFVSNLIQAARADRAVDLLARRRKDITEVEIDSVFEALEALPIVERDPDEPNRDSSMRWEIQELFNVLYKMGMSQVERLVRLELLCHEIFENDEGQLFQPKGLLVAIRDSPSLFIDLLTYPWNDDTGESATPDDEFTIRLTDKVCGLLSKLVELPGQSEICPMNDKTVSQWIAEVIRIATERRYLTALQMQLPSIIANGAWDDIDSWPSPEITEVINLLAEVDHETFRQELASSLFNVRGVHFIDPTGESDKSKAEKLRVRANQLQQACPAAAWALLNIAQSLDSEASHNVERAKWRQ